MKRYPGGMIGGVPEFNAINREYVRVMNTIKIRCEQCEWIGPVPNNVRCPKCDNDLTPWEPRIVKERR